jgi:formyl-CoA transferase
MQAASGVLGALYERERTGKGSQVGVTMVEAAMALIPDCFTAYTQSGFTMSQESRSAISLSFAFACGDEKLLAIHVSSMEKFWRALLEAIERPDIGVDPRFSSRAERIRNYSALLQALRPVFAARPRPYWMERLAVCDVPCAVVNSIPEALHDPEIAHLGMFHELEHPRYGKITAMRRASRIDGERESGPLPPPALGEHTDEVLGEFGFAAAEIAELRGAGVV